MATEKLRRVGWALVAVGLIDIAFMVYCIMNEISYRSSLNVFAVIAGILLVRKSMRTANVVSFFAAFMMAGAMGALVLFPLLVPFDFLITMLRLSPLSLVSSVLVGIAFLLLAFWVYRNLTAPEVMEARRAAGVNAKPPIAGFIAGGVLVVGLFTIMTLVMHGSSSEIAIEKARAETGPGYSYYVTSMSWSGDSGRATVTAYNDTEVRDVNVQW